MSILVEETLPISPSNPLSRLSPERMRVPWPVRLLPIIVLVAALFAQLLLP